MDREYEISAPNVICILAGLTYWLVLIAAPLQMAGVI